MWVSSHSKIDPNSTSYILKVRGLLSILASLWIQIYNFISDEGHFRGTETAKYFLRFEKRPKRKKSFIVHPLDAIQNQGYLLNQPIWSVVGKIFKISTFANMIKMPTRHGNAPFRPLKRNLVGRNRQNKNRWKSIKLSQTLLYFCSIKVMHSVPYNFMLNNWKPSVKCDDQHFFHDQFRLPRLSVV